MKITKKLRNHILNTVSQIALSKLEEYCPSATGDTPPEGWPDDGTKERFDLITDVTSAIESGLQSKLNALSV